MLYDVFDVVCLASARLAGDNAGRLEVYYNDTWGTVCWNGFGYREAQVACYMLGCTVCISCVSVVNVVCVCLVSVRLAGDNRPPNAGRLEVYYNDTWGTVCRNGFDNIDAQVACFMLGLG